LTGSEVNVASIPKKQTDNFKNRKRINHPQIQSSAVLIFYRWGPLHCICSKIWYNLYEPDYRDAHISCICILMPNEITQIFFPVQVNLEAFSKLNNTLIIEIFDLFQILEVSYLNLNDHFYI